MKGLARCILTAVLSIGLLPQISLAADGDVALYCNEFSLPGMKMDAADQTIEAVRKAVAPRRFVVKTVSLPELESAISQKKVDIAIVGSAIYWRNIQKGMRDIATLITPLQPDPDHAVGALIVALKDRKDINSINDLKGKRLGINLPNGFQCYLTVLKDIADLGYDHKHFFSQVTAFGLLPEKRIEALRQGTVDAVTLNACYAERMRRQGVDVMAGLKPVGLRRQSQIRCMASTALYPNWSFLISPNLDTQTILKIASALYRMPASRDGQYWSIASSYTSTDQLYRKLRMGPYAYLDEWTLRRIWDEYRLPIMLLAMFLCFGIWHSLRTQHLVKLRTEQLSKSFAEKQFLETQAKEASVKYQAIKHAFSVSQLSSLVAHELSQPLASVKLYAQGLRIMTQSPDQTTWDSPKIREGIDKIISRSGRAQEIVNAVRAYAKSGESNYVSADVCMILRLVVERIKATQTKRKPVFALSLPNHPVMILCSCLELELAFANLIQNSLEAVPEPQVPEIGIELSIAGQGRCQIAFSDNGPAVSDELLDRVKEPTKSIKAQGLGLGLSIVRAIAEKHMGRVTIGRSARGGILVTMILPIDKE